VLVLIGPILVGAVASRAATATGWSIVESLGAGDHSTLQSVTAIASDDVWAVGSRPGTSGNETLAAHRDGSGWSTISSPNPGTDGNGFHGVAAADATHVWAVGTQVGVSGNQPLIEMWNGSSWTEQSPSGSGELFGVAALSTTDAWAVGTTPDGDALIERWNGSTWGPVSGDDPSTHDTLLGVAAISGTDAWAVGRSDTGTLIEHWNGSAWSAVASPAGVLSGVAAFAADDVWAVGGSGGDPLALHWDGMTWSDTDAPTPSPGVASFSAVAGSGPDDVWAVGVWDPITDQTFIEHRDGTAWSIVPGPNPPTSASTSFAGVSVLSATDAWAVGVDGYDGEALIARYAEGDFTSALQVRAPPPITVGDPSSVQGTLTFSGNAPAGGQTIHVARTNPDATVTDLGDVGTIWPGGFAVSDTPPVRGTYTYTASFDGNGTYPAATGSAQLTVLGTPVQLSIAASAHHLVVGKAVTLTARLSLHQAGRSVSLLGKVPGGGWTPVAAGTVDGSGRFSVRIRPAYNATYRARFAGDATHAPATSGTTSVTVAAIVTVRTVGGYATKAGYRLYHFSQTCASAKHRDCPLIAVMVSPNRPGAEVTVDLLGRVHGAWRLQGTTTARLGPASSAGIQ
jgi:hypothetical protein